MDEADVVAKKQDSTALRILVPTCHLHMARIFDVTSGPRNKGPPRMRFDVRREADRVKAVIRDTCITMLTNVHRNKSLAKLYHLLTPTSFPSLHPDCPWTVAYNAIARDDLHQLSVQTPPPRTSTLTRTWC